MSEITYSTITVRGKDAFDFLQAQLTADLNDLPQDPAAAPFRSAWCNPKGRVICIVDLKLSADGFELTLPADLTDAVLQRMTMFRFRSQVEFDVQSGQAGSQDTDIERLRAGIAQVTLAQSEKFTPHMLNLDVLKIVSLEKGCYPGQEIVARTHYRGASKRRCLLFQSSEAVQAGDKVEHESRAIGEVVNVIGTDLLAVIPMDAANSDLSVGEASLTLKALPYSL
jgi:folate-binding protein YgfZ